MDKGGRGVHTGPVHNSLNCNKGCNSGELHIGHLHKSVMRLADLRPT